MSISIAYKFEIKSKKPKKLLDDLFNNHYPIIDFNCIKKMPNELINETTYENWAIENFGHSYKWGVDDAYILDNKSIIFIEGNKTQLILEPWFDKFKEDLEVFIYSEYDSSETPLDDYVHVYYKENKIVSLRHSDELGLKINEILISKDKEQLVDFLIHELDFPDEFKDDDLKSILIRFISVFPIIYKYLPDEYKNNLDIIDKVLNNNANLYKYLDEKLKKEKNIIIKSLLSNNNFNYNKSEYLYSDIHKVVKEKYIDDLEVLKLLIKNDPIYLKTYIDKFYDDKDVALSALGMYDRSRGLFDKLSTRLKNDLDIAKKCCQSEPYSDYDKDFINLYSDNKEVALYALDYADKTSRVYDCILGKLSERLRNDKDIVIKSLKKQPKSFEYVGNNFTKNPDICIRALKNDLDNIAFVSDELLKNYDFCCEIIKLFRKKDRLDSNNYHWRYFLQYLKNEKILNDKKIVLEAIDKDAILWSPNKIFKRYLNDEDIMIRALIKDDFLYQYLPKKYRDIENYTIAALTNRLLSKELFSMQSSIELIKKLTLGTSFQGIARTINKSILTQAGMNLEYASNRLKNNKNIVLYAIRQTPSAFLYASSRLKEDRDILKLLFNSKEFESMNTYDIIIQIINNNPEFYNCYGIKYRKNYNLTLNVIDNYDKIYNNFDLNVPFSKFTNEQLENIYKKIFSKWPEYFKELPDEYRNNRNIVLEAIKAYGNNLQYAAKIYQEDEELIKVARNQMNIYNTYEKFYLDNNINDEKFDLSGFDDLEIRDDDLPF